MGKERVNFAISGQTGSGKSTLARDVIDAHPRRDRMLILVPPHVVDFKYPGVEVHTKEQAWKAMKGRRTFQVIWRAPKGWQSAEWAARAIWSLQDALLVLDEAQLYLSEPDGRGELRAFCPPSFFELATTGRHRQAAFGLITPRPVFIPPSIRTECQIVAAFVLAGLSDRKALAGFPGFDASTPAQIQELSTYEYLRADFGKSLGKLRTKKAHG